MLCKRPTRKIEESVKEMGGSKFFIEEKLDGERIQLHKRGNEYFYCSRQVPASFIAYYSHTYLCTEKEKTTLTCTESMSVQEV